MGGVDIRRPLCYQCVFKIAIGTVNDFYAVYNIYYWTTVYLGQLKTPLSRLVLGNFVF